MLAIFVHNPATWTFTFGGLEIQGFSDGDLAVITPPADGFKETEGAKGDIVISTNPSFLWTVKFTLFERSSVNDVLDGFYGTQRYEASTGQPIGSPFTAFDPISGRTWGAAQAWIPGIPPTTPGGKREWSIKCPMTRYPGTKGV